MIKIDNEIFDVGIVNIERQANIHRKELGTTFDGVTHDIAIGTSFNYSVTFATKKMNINEYSRLYEVLSNPVNYHIVEMPYNDTTITYRARVENINDSIICNYNNFRKWSSFKVTFESLQMQKMA